MNPDEDTEFNDALRKHGILPPRPEAPRTPSPPPSPSLPDILLGASPSKLQSLEDEANDSETERMIESYRQQRLKEMKKEQVLARFGSVQPIGRDGYSREVTDASKVDEDDVEGRGTGVVCFLYKDADIPCARLTSQLRTLAARYPRTKFVSIIGNKCIENYPDRHLPTMFLYRRGNIVQQVIAWGAERERSLEETEVLLLTTGIVTPTESTIADVSRRGAGSDEDEDEIEAISRQVRGRRAEPEFASKKAPKNLRGPAADDDDSDFDL